MGWAIWAVMTSVFAERFSSHLSYSAAAGGGQASGAERVNGRVPGGKKVSELVLVCRHLVVRIGHHMRCAWQRSKLQEADEKSTHLL